MFSERQSVYPCKNGESPKETNKAAAREAQFKTGGKNVLEEVFSGLVKANETGPYLLFWLIRRERERERERKKECGQVSENRLSE